MQSPLFTTETRDTRRELVTAVLAQLPDTVSAWLPYIAPCSSLEFARALDTLDSLRTAIEEEWARRSQRTS